MKLRSTYTGLASGFLIGSSLFIGLIASTPQFTADSLVYLGLGAGFLLAVTSLLSFIGIAFRKSVLKTQLASRHIAASIRQGLEVAVLLVVLATIWYLTGLSWWEAILLILATIFAELTLLFKKSAR